MRVLEAPARTLERPILDARDLAEQGARKALQRLALDEEKPRASMSEAERKLRVQLRALGRRLGGSKALAEACAYEHWHRMLFARFLAENDLLMHPEIGVPVTLDECAELAREAGEDDPWVLAAQFAARMLPGVFPLDDPLLAVVFAPEDRIRLEEALSSLPAEVFLSDDGLGWTYQFWQSRRKAEVNHSERKIGGADLPAVTQLFTEHYMVQFLLHNSLGAWWAARHTGEDLPTEMDYLRRLEDGTPAAGGFPGWPASARELRILDPCCGSGHFLIAAFALVVRLRMREEGLAEAQAGDAVLGENLFGLEIDPRCTQIAAFGLALAAWTRGGYRPLPPMNIACSGLPLGGDEADWVKLAAGAPKLQAGLRALYRLFLQAPDLGSLIDPVRDAAEVWAGNGRDTKSGNLFAGDPDEILAAVEQAIRHEQDDGDETAGMRGVAARGAMHAARLLAQKYHLVITNVPYLGRGKQGDALRRFIEAYHADAKGDLGTAFVDRCGRMCAVAGTLALVTPQSWWFQASYLRFRKTMLTRWAWACAAPLGEEAWRSFGQRGPRAVMIICSNHAPRQGNTLFAIDAAGVPTIPEKINLLRCGELQWVTQAAQLANPDSRITVEAVDGTTLLSTYARSVEGASSGDLARYVFMFWEVTDWGSTWTRFQRAPEGGTPYSGCRAVWRWEEGRGPMALSDEARITGQAAWGRRGVLVGLMRYLRMSLYTGAQHDKITAAIVPHQEAHLPAIYRFCLSEVYQTAVRRMNPAVQVGTGTLVKVPFDMEYWQAEAEKAGPLPAPYSEDPTQWLFKGNVKESDVPLQVAVARLLGYRWPEQPEEDALSRFADADGIVCLPAVRGERPAADRLVDLLAAAYGPEWGGAKLDELLAGVGHRGKEPAAWLRDAFFEQHARLFHNRPFIWHVWDGRPDGFAALVNCHRLDRADLEKLTYFYLGDWIDRQRQDVGQQKVGAEARLAAAEALQKKLAAILEGEKPFDIYVRWKPKERQPIGWEPDLNDGVRLNIRPFVEAQVLRSRVSVSWGKDRGRNPDGSERTNDVHLALDEKRKAREAAR